MKNGLLFLLFLLTAGLLSAQNKRPLKHSDYDNWTSARSEVISPDGKWIGWQQDKQEGDGKFYLRKVSESSTNVLVIDRGYSARFTPDSKFLVLRIKPTLAQTKKAKKDKLVGDKAPKDSLLIYNLKTGEQKIFAGLKSINYPTESGNTLAFVLEKKEEPKTKLDSTSAKKDTAAKAAVKPPVSKAKKPKGEELHIYSPESKTDTVMKFAAAYHVSENGKWVLFAREQFNDTTVTAGMWLWNTDKNTLALIDSGLKTYKAPIIDKNGKHLAYLATSDSAESEIKLFNLFHRGISDNALKRIDSIAPKARVSEFREPKFSEDGSRLYFGLAPKMLPSLKDTTRPDEENVKLDVWNYKDERLQPEQLKNLKDDKEKSVLSYCQLNSDKVVQLGNDDIFPMVSMKRNNKWIAAFSNKPYRVSSSWDPGYADLYVMNSETGEFKLIAKKQKAFPTSSPFGKYIYWYADNDTAWKAYNTETGQLVNLSSNVKTIIYDDLNDVPDFPNQQGSAGWTKNDEFFIFYDKHDAWMVDPTGKKPPMNFTSNAGTSNNKRFRYLPVDPEMDYIDLKSDQFFAFFNLKTKEAGLAKRDTKGMMTELFGGGYQYFGVRKAKETDVFAWYRENYNHPPELFVAGKQFSAPVQLTTMQSQLDTFAWGSVELVNWKSYDGKPLEGLLYLPANYEKDKRYPTIVYYYERNSEELYNFYVPAPSRSVVNIPYYTSNGYAVFVPDIVYSVADPGKSAYNCIMPGVDMLIAKGVTDSTKMGLQGQSWGGYQTAYMVTQTDRFACGMAGAPVSNMTSAYGGIRWGSGLVRQFQYEHQQSRIGQTLWENREAYIRNSPVFFADKVNTPLLIMHNDQDGAVPWYQGIEYFTALRRFEKPVWMLVYNNEDHNLVGRYPSKDLSIRMSQFFDTYLMGKPMPAWMSEGRSALDKDRFDLKY